MINIFVHASVSTTFKFSVIGFEQILLLHVPKMMQHASVCLNVNVIRASKYKTTFSIGIVGQKVQ